LIKILSRFYHVCGIILVNNNLMFQFIHSIGQNLQLIVEHGGYILLSFTSIMEGIPIAGQFVPGNTIVVISGFFSKIDLMNVYYVAIIVLISSMIGDYIGYTIGRKYGFDFINKYGPYFFIKKEYIDKTRSLIQENSAKTIIFGRFTPITRSFTPFIVGASGIHINRFWLYDFIAVFMWAIFSIGIGYIFGAGYNAVSEVMGKYIMVAVFIGILVTWGYGFINKHFHVFVKYELITLFVNLFGLYLFFKTIQDALTDKVFLLQFDIFANTFFATHITPFTSSVMNIITNVFSPLSIVFYSLIGIAYFMYKKSYHNSVIIFLSLSGTYLITFLVKNMVLRPRPELGYIIESGYSFPSGHAIAITTFSILLVYLFFIKIQSTVVRELCITLSVILLLTVSFSRVYLGVHWISDVLAGIGLGLFYTTLVILLVKYFRMLYIRYRTSNI